ncbi:MAG: ABC transporter ATP-binding protein [Anaerolineales bacterium]|nr:ABC transporter ATP-binding protein [Anaerolineales bacterium]
MLLDWKRFGFGVNGRSTPATAFYQTVPSDGMIDLRGIVKAYETDAGPFLALKGIDLKVGEGEFVAVVGKSGSGKSTLINMFTGIDHPTKGEVIVANTPIRRLDEGQMAQWRGKHMGIIFQFFQLLPTLTIVENVMIPMDLAALYDLDERYDRAIHLLEQMQMADEAHKFPGAISGGQQQRAAIARALANDPPILVADEPTGNLDSKTATAVFDLFASLIDDGKTILMVTHDNDLANQAGRKVTIADGRIVNDVTR